MITIHLIFVIRQIRQVVLWLSFFVMISAIPFRTFAADKIIVEDFTYTIDNVSQTATIVGLTDNKVVLTNPVLPDCIIIDNIEYLVTEVGEEAFRTIPGLNAPLRGQIKLPKYLKKIGNRAFSSSTLSPRLSGSLILPEGLEYIGEHAFSGQSFSGNLTIPNSVSYLGELAFRESGFSDTLLVHAPISEIPYGCFWDCRFKVIELSNTIKKINSYAFQSEDNYMHRVKKINFSNNLEEIGNQSFNYSLYVDIIDLPATFNKFGIAPFSHCKIDTIICRNPIPPVESSGYDNGTAGNYFGSAPSKGILLVPKESIKLYSEAPYWKDFKNIHGLDGVPAESIYLNYEELILFVGESKTITAKVLPEDTTDKTITWISDNETIATVSIDGTVTAVSVGIANITAACGNATATCKVTVNPVSASGITLNTQDMTLLVGQTDRLTAIVEPENTTDKTLTWGSDNEAIATVGTDGTVTAVSVGVANITATCGDVSATCKVTVNPITATTVTINVPDTEVYVGDKVTLSATVAPDNTTDKNITWSCSTPEIATIDAQSGELTALAPGEAKITATCGDISGTATVTVKPILATELTLSAQDMTLLVGQTGKLTATVTPDNTTDKTVIWKSDNETIAKVEAGGTVTAVSVGVANITATCGEVSATCKVTVNPITATTVTINVPDTEVYVGDKVTLSATVAPDNTTDKNITWSCSTPEIATIDAQSGELTALAPGEAKITATCGDISGTATVTVKPILATELTLSAQDMTLLVGQTGKLTATVTPDNTTDKTVIWKSDNETIAKVEAGGTVTAVSVGAANITATCGDVSATCKVTVNARPKTPKQYVRKGNGKSCIFVVMMNLTDKELTQQGCRFAYGYTDTQGDEHILATSNHRYCHTSEQIYNDASNDFWVVAYWDKDNSIVTSVRRHLDGTTDDDFDQSILTNYLTRPIDSSDPDNWIRPTSRGAQISISSTEPTTVAIYNLNGVIIHCSNYERGTEVSEDIILDRYISNTYIITVQSGDIKSTKKIIIR